MKSLSIINIEITPDNRRKIDRLCYHYGQMAFVYGNEERIAGAASTYLANFSADSELSFERAKVATGELMKLFMNEGLSNKLPGWLRPRIGSFLTALHALMSELQDDDLLNEAVDLERIDQRGVELNLLKDRFEYYSKKYNEAKSSAPNARTNDWRQFSKEQIEQLEKELKVQEEIPLKAA